MTEVNKKKTVVLRAPLLTQSGYGVHARQVARWLFNRQDKHNDITVYTNPVPWGDTPWFVDVEAENGLIGRVIQTAQNAESYDVSIQLQLPNEWNPFLADYNVGMTAAVEGDRCNPEWVSACNGMDLIIVPSEFTKTVLTNTGEITTPIVVIPESFPDAIIEARDSDYELPLNLDTKFNLLVFGQLTGDNPENDRKNLAYTIKWLAEVFEGNEDVGIVVKTNIGRSTKLDLRRSKQFLGQLVAQVTKGNGPKFHLLHGDMSNTDIAALYKNPQVNGLVSLTRGEGFGLPLLEAAVSDLPIVATNWSAHTEFLNRGKFIKVDYTLQDIHESRVDGKIWVEGARWANAKEADAKKKIKRFYESPKVPKEWAVDLGAKLRESHSFEAISALYDEVFIGKVI